MSPLSDFGGIFTETLTKKQKTQGRILMASTAVLWGLAGVCVKSIEWSSFSLMAARSIISLIMLFILKGSLRLKFTKPNILGAVMMSATGILYVEAIKLTTAGTAIVLQYIAPIIVFLYSVIFQKKKAKPYEALITLAVFFGCFLSFSDSLEPTKIAGNILGILSGFTFAFQIIIMNSKEADSQDSQIISNIFSFFFCLPFMFFDKGLVFDAKNITWVLILGIFQYGLANVLFSKGIKLVDKVEGSLILTIEPVFNPIPVAIICGEMMGLRAIIGSVIVIVFVALYSVLSGKSEKAEKALTQ